MENPEIVDVGEPDEPARDRVCYAYPLGSRWMRVIVPRGIGESFFVRWHENTDNIEAILEPRSPS